MSDRWHYFLLGASVFCIVVSLAMILTGEVQK